MFAEILRLDSDFDITTGVFPAWEPFCAFFDTGFELLHQQGTFPGLQARPAKRASSRAWDYRIGCWCSVNLRRENVVVLALERSEHSSHLNWPDDTNRRGTISVSMADQGTSASTVEGAGRSGVATEVLATWPGGHKPKLEASL